MPDRGMCCESQRMATLWKCVKSLQILAGTDPPHHTLAFSIYYNSQCSPQLSQSVPRQRERGSLLSPLVGLQLTLSLCFVTVVAQSSPTLYLR